MCDRANGEGAGEYIAQIGDAGINLTNRTPITRVVSDAWLKIGFIGIPAKRVSVRRFQSFLGHEDKHTTLNIYAHTNVEDAMETSKAMGTYSSRSAPSVLQSVLQGRKHSLLLTNKREKSKEKAPKS